MLELEAEQSPVTAIDHIIIVPVDKDIDLSEARTIAVYVEYKLLGVSPYCPDTSSQYHR